MAMIRLSHWSWPRCAPATRARTVRATSAIVVSAWSGDIPIERSSRKDDRTTRRGSGMAACCLARGAVPMAWQRTPGRGTVVAPGGYPARMADSDMTMAVVAALATITRSGARLPATWKLDGGPVAE